MLGDQNHGTNVETPLDTSSRLWPRSWKGPAGGPDGGLLKAVVFRAAGDPLSAVYGVRLTDEDVGRAVRRWLTQTGPCHREVITLTLTNLFQIDGKSCTHRTA